MRKYIFAGWITFALTALYLHFFHRAILQKELETAFGMSFYVGYALFLLVGSLRGLTLIPVTYIIVLGLLFFNPLPLFVMTMIGIVISSLSVYYFSEYMRFDKTFEKKYPEQIRKLKAAFSKRELPIIILWSFFPLTPTDLICYVAGSLRVDVKKLILGVIVGETITSGVYIFFGSELLKNL